MPHNPAGAILPRRPGFSFFMHVQFFPPLSPFGSTENEHLEINAGEKGDGSVFRIWSVTPDHSLFLRILTEPDGYASYLVATAQDVFPEPLRFLPFSSRRKQRRARRLLRRWGVVGTPASSGSNDARSPPCPLHQNLTRSSFFPKT